MNDNKLIEMLHAMQDRETLQRDLQEIAATAQDALHKKYISRLHNALLDQAARTRKNPPKEARLLEACKPFLPAEKHAALDHASRLFHALDTCKQVHSHLAAQSVRTMEAAEAAAPPRGLPASLAADPSVHRDGIYDIDSQCARIHGSHAAMRTEQPPMAMLMLMFMLMAEM